MVPAEQDVGVYILPPNAVKLAAMVMNPRRTFSTKSVGATAEAREDARGRVHTRNRGAACVPCAVPNSEGHAYASMRRRTLSRVFWVAIAESLALAHTCFKLIVLVPKR
jgi:hypothetical protein